MIDIERVACVMIDAMGTPGKAASVVRETVRALLTGGAKISDPIVIDLERVALGLDEVADSEPRACRRDEYGACRDRMRVAHECD